MTLYYLARAKNIVPLPSKSLVPLNTQKLLVHVVSTYHTASNKATLNKIFVFHSPLRNICMWASDSKKARK